MSPEKEKRLKELETKWKLVYEGTGKIIGHSGPGGAPVYDEDILMFDGTEDEGQEYSALWCEKCVEQYKHESMALLRSITDVLYSGKQLNK